MKSSIYALAASASTALAAVRGFNYGSVSQTQATFEEQFNVAKGLVGADDFTSARLYTMIQDATTNTVISAIPAAIATNTTLLLGLWASETQAAFDNELTALKDAISQYGSEVESLVVGISVGSEDLYRISPTGIAADEGTGQEPTILVDYISQVRAAISGTVFSSIPVGHVDTWNSYTNSSNAAVIEACDFLGVDAYPYYQSTYTNSIENSGNLFFSAYDQVIAAADGKPVWVTESGWPVSGATVNLAVASTANAETYWQDVACKLESEGVNFWWYILVDSGANPSFGVTGSLSTTPLYNLACNSTSSSSSSSTVSSKTTSVSSVASATMPTTAALSTTISISNAVPTGGVGSSTVASSAGSAVGSAVSSISKAASSATASSAVGSAVSSISKAASSGTAVAPVTTGYSTVVGSDGVSTIHVYSTTLVTVTGCNVEFATVCPASSTAAASASSVLASAASSVTASAASSVVPTGTATSSGCPADISGAYQYPHLIVPVNASSPNTAYGTSYNGTVTPTVSTIFNFDIPASYANKTCSTVFLFPELSQLETSSYSFNGKGGFTISILKGVATESTTYANAPAVAAQIGSVPALTAGSSYTLSHDSCPAGTRVSFEVSSTGGLDLEFFEDYNPSPLGLYVRAC